MSKSTAKKKPRKRAVYIPDWPTMHDVAEEYNIDIYRLVEAIKNRKIKTRGLPYDEVEQYGNDEDCVDIKIAPKIWRDFWFEETKDSTFLYTYRSAFFGYMREVQKEIRTGYSNIQVNRKDFEKKIDKIKSIPSGKRSHKHMFYIKQAYDQFKKQRGVERVSAQELWDYLAEHNIRSECSAHNLEIIKIPLAANKSADEKRQLVMHYDVEGKKSKKRKSRMKYSTFCNVVSRFNNSKIKQ
jgi:hypothetical protein